MKKNSLETVLYSIAGVAIVFLILVAFNILTGTMKRRVDLTKEKAYTLSDGTKAILGKLDTPVKIRYYFSSSAEFPSELLFLKTYAQQVRDLLDEYRQASNGKVIIEQFDPKPDSDAEDAARLDGIEGQMLPTGDPLYLGACISMLDTKEVMQFQREREQMLEYDLSRAISRVIKPEKAVVGIMSALPVFGMPSNPMMMQMGQRPPDPWILVNELREDYTLKDVAMTTDKIDDDIKVLLVIHPRDISEQAQYAIDQFIMRGGKLAAFLDASPVTDKRGGENPMMGQMPAAGSTLDKLLKAWGIQFDTSKIVADMNYKMRLRGRDGQPTEEPAFLAVEADAGGINKDDIDTGQINDVWLPLSGVFTGTPTGGLKQTVLLKTTKDSQLVDSMMAAMGGGASIMGDFKPSGTEYTLAMRLTGKFKTAFPSGKPEEKVEGADATGTNKVTNPADSSLKETKEDNAVVLFGDADFLFDQFAVQQRQGLFGPVTVEMNGNLSLAMNIVEHLSGDPNLIGVRSRAKSSRPFTRIKEMEAKTGQVLQEKQREYAQSRQEAQQKITELERNKEPGQQFIISPEQQAEREKWRTTVAKLDKEWRSEKKRLARDKEALQNKIKWGNILGMPILVAVFGIGLAVIKRNRTSAK